MRLSIYGDLMLGRDVQKSIENRTDIFLNIGKNLKRGINICNLEFPFVENPINNKKLFSLNKNIDFLKYFYGVTLANNHIFDQNEDGFFNTLGILDKYHIKHTGAGINKEDAFFPITVDFKEISIKILGITSIENISKSDYKFIGHYALFEDEKMIKKFIEKYRKKSNYLIVLPHMGIEYIDIPKRGIKEKYLSLIDMGFDMVVGSHPHTIQGYEVLENKYIYYSLGDFVFDNLGKLRRKSLYLNVVFDRSGVKNITNGLLSKKENLEIIQLNDSYTEKFMKKKNFFLKIPFFYYVRFLICKAYNQYYNLTEVCKKYGVKKFFELLFQKILLLLKRLTIKSQVVK